MLQIVHELVLNKCGCLKYNRGDQNNLSLHREHIQACTVQSPDKSVVHFLGKINVSLLHT